MDAVYIIGGATTKNVVAKFQKNKWFRLANLLHGRTGNTAFKIGSQTVILGGVNDDTVNHKTDIAVTELWNFETGAVNVIKPTLPESYYWYGLSFYLVEENFCNMEV